MLFLKPRQTLCSRCLGQRLFSTALPQSLPSHAPKPPPLPQSPPTSGFANLTTRRLISLSGRDASKFLQGLTTANIPSRHSKSVEGYYSAFLNAQGKVLHDVFIYPAAHSSAYRESIINTADQKNGEEQGFLIEVDADVVGSLGKWLKRYKLRADITIRILDEGEWNVYSVWNDSSPSVPPPTSDSTLPAHPGFAALDTRAPSFGERIILPNSLTPKSLNPEAVGEEASVDQYAIRRYLRGIPEGQSEIIRELALPQESCLDYMLGIDFRKGCYVGQELITRTHHTGVVRKRILPIQIYQSTSEVRFSGMSQYDNAEAKNLLLPPPGTHPNMSRLGPKGIRPGRWVAGIGNVGLALCRLEAATASSLTGGVGRWSLGQELRVAWEIGGGEGDGRGGGEVKFKAFIPDWHEKRKVIVGLKKFEWKAEDQ